MTKSPLSRSYKNYPTSPNFRFWGFKKRLPQDFIRTTLPAVAQDVLEHNSLYRLPIDNGQIWLPLLMEFAAICPLVKVEPYRLQAKTWQSPHALQPRSIKRGVSGSLWNSYFWQKLAFWAARIVLKNLQFSSILLYVFMDIKIEKIYSRVQ